MISCKDHKMLAAEGISGQDLEQMGIEWVAPSADGRRQGYFRKIAQTRHEPTIRQAEHRLLFAETSFNAFGERGVTKTLDDRHIPKNAEIIANKLQGTGQPERTPSLQEKLIKLILER